MLSIYSDKFTHVQVVINCPYFVAHLCTSEATLPHNLGALYFAWLAHNNNIILAYGYIPQMVSFYFKHRKLLFKYQYQYLDKREGWNIFFKTNLKTNSTHRPRRSLCLQCRANLELGESQPRSKSSLDDIFWSYFESFFNSRTYYWDFLNLCSFLLLRHSCSKKSSSREGKLTFKGLGCYFPRTLSQKNVHWLFLCVSCHYQLISLLISLYFVGQPPYPQKKAQIRSEYTRKMNQKES